MDTHPPGYPSRSGDFPDQRRARGQEGGKGPEVAGCVHHRRPQGWCAKQVTGADHDDGDVSDRCWRLTWTPRSVPRPGTRWSMRLSASRKNASSIWPCCLELTERRAAAEARSSMIRRDRPNCPKLWIPPGFVTPSWAMHWSPEPCNLGMRFAQLRYTAGPDQSVRKTGGSSWVRGRHMYLLDMAKLVNGAYLPEYTALMGVG